MPEPDANKLGIPKGFCLSQNHDFREFATILKSCAACSAIRWGKVLHSSIVKLGHLSCQYVSKPLLNVYAKCGALSDCQKLFGEMGNHDPVSWNIVLSGFAGVRTHDVEAMRMFCAMHVANEPKPTSITIAIILPVYARLGELCTGKSVHSYAIKSGLETHTLVGNALVSMYAKCGLVLNDSYAAFNSIGDKDVVSWNAIIAGFSENGLMEDAFRLFRLMLKGSTKPNYATIVNIIPVCSSFHKFFAYHFGKEIHGYILRRNELGTDGFVSNALMSFYLRVGRMEVAELLFQRINSKDLVSWNALIAGYASNGEWLKALELFRKLLSLKTIGPDSVTLVSILPACAHLHNLQVGKEIHGFVLRHPHLQDDTAVGNALVNFYAKCDKTEAAYHTFLMISKRDLISWNSMLDAFVESGLHTQFLDLLHRMLSQGISPDSITILSIICFCYTLLRTEKVKETHCYSIKAGLFLGDTEPTIGNAMLDAYAKCGNLDYAFKVFQSLSGMRNLVTFNSMISSYISYGSHDKAHTIFNEMSATDLTTYNLMVRVYAENDNPDQALNLFREMQARGMKPDAVSIVSVLPVCTQMASAHLLRQCHGYATRACLDDLCLKGAILDVYAKCGSVDCAHKLFQSSPQKDLVMFTAMVGGYAMHGMGKEALEVFSHMLEWGVKPDHVIITSVLSACSHAGLVNEGLDIFCSIEKTYGMKLTMEQYSCVVDLLARGGQVNDAYSLVSGMPIEANANVWGTLLGACRTHHEVELGRVVADRLFTMEANNIGNYVVMSNLYAAEAIWDRVMEIRKLIRTRDLKKPAGCSWIELEQKKNIFIAGDSSHPQRSIIYSTLSALDQQIKEPFQLKQQLNLLALGVS
ncbi:hypothetical protein HS088_TW07G00660 [Tripterygium wilfordii]|uniref:Pentatricopeptide repeat-containing protein n=1 Tax=Tripterygium wilfordii TaxID=458696 RepID=A0A7J7DFL8_TRIWF|nr:putative pentatricopeptide repeat-containing protein At5g08490 [Tripterygium wilfordii]XP_038705403.1 putative pentatricopeptide repeat-containing protein At5g08490 [Tripterygium wilfordii]XP_038705404.1 putative pentatricopeptide repeat-containing protein At5g08490 [Tripterygium wilfordii]XP_038705405.1 putative pentatricopeptide repeat-containing protein At5g08490 [Tripterygium wilfordii]XP_038705406.1 putative pentatricopeptide repeat-containing protein At5g08490 [Tripterygium wilfordii]